MEDSLQTRELVVQLPVSGQQVVALRPIIQQDRPASTAFMGRNPAPNSSPVVAGATFDRHSVNP